MKRRTLLLLFLIWPLLATAETYRWVDDNGIPHLSQVPPKSGEYTIIDMKSPPKLLPDEDTKNESLDEDPRQAELLQAEREEQEYGRTRREELCREAIERLAFLEGQGDTSEQGQSVRDTEEKFQQRLNIRTHCD